MYIYTYMYIYIYMPVSILFHMKGLGYCQAMALDTYILKKPQITHIIKPTARRALSLTKAHALMYFYMANNIETAIYIYIYILRFLVRYVAQKGRSQISSRLW